MQRKDSTQRFIFENLDVRGEITHLHESFKTIMLQHHYPAQIQQFLGEVLVASVLLTTTIKFHGQLTIQLQSDGPIELLVAKCDHHLNIRGLAQWKIDAIQADFDRALGEGSLVITIEQDKQVQPYQSIVPLNHQSVAQALEFYFLQSEQLPTKIWLAVEADRAAGMLLQKLPSIIPTEEEEHWQELMRLSDQMEPEELLRCQNKHLLQQLYPEDDLRLFNINAVQFHCGCSIAKMQNAILTMGEAEINDILKDQEEVVVTCEYCNHEYAFGREEVANIFSSEGGMPDEGGEQTRH